MPPLELYMKNISDFAIATEKPFTVEVEGRTLSIKPLPYEDYNKYIGMLTAMYINCRSYLEEMDLSDEAGWLKAIGTKNVLNWIVAIISKVQGIPKRWVKRKLTPAQIAQVFYAIYHLNITVPKKKIRENMALITGIGSKPTGAILRPRFGKGATRNQKSMASGG
jgi:hypothetical protein